MCLRNLFGGNDCTWILFIIIVLLLIDNDDCGCGGSAAVVAAAANLLQKTPGAENRAGRFSFC